MKKPLILVVLFAYCLVPAQNYGLYKQYAMVSAYVNENTKEMIYVVINPTPVEKIIKLSV